jgi:hypothetical protein
MQQCEECGHVWNGLAQCTHPYRGHPIQQEDSDRSQDIFDPGYDSDDPPQHDDDDGDDDDDDDEGDGDNVDPEYLDMIYSDISNEVMSQEMEAIEQLNNTCDLVCQDLHFSGEFCRHSLIMCNECGHVWDGNAQCTHPNL